jgi:nucleoid-associated protein YgaU
MVDPEQDRLNKIKAGLKKPVRPVVKPRPRPVVKQVAPRPKVEIARPTPIAAPAPKVIAEHTVVAEDTLSGIALKYYGSAAKKWYMYIYETNKAVIGDSPNVIRQGIVLKILEKPEL